MKIKKIKNKMIIVCGGRGKRMGKITNSMPKPLIKVGKNPIIEHKIKYYNKEGIDKIIFCLGYKAKQLKNFLIKKTSLIVLLYILNKTIKEFFNKKNF